MKTPTDDMNGRIDMTRPDIVHIGDEVMIGNEARIITHCVSRMYDRDPNIYIEDWAWIGFRAIVLPGVRIGKASVIGAGSVVTQNCDSFSIYAGNPARFVRYRTAEELINYATIRSMKETMGRVEPDYSKCDITKLKSIFEGSSRLSINLEEFKRVYLHA